MIVIDGIEYIEQSVTDLPFGNVCRHCAFYGKSCYNRDDFTCHSDSRPNGMGVVFVMANQAFQPSAKSRAG